MAVRVGIVAAAAAAAVMEVGEDCMSVLIMSSFFGIREVGLGEAMSPSCDIGKDMSYFGDIGREVPEAAPEATGAREVVVWPLSVRPGGLIIFSSHRRGCGGGGSGGDGLGG